MKRNKFPTKKCTKCKEIKLLSEFPTKKYNYWCKECENNYYREWKNRNKEKIKEYSKKQNIKRKGKIKEYNKQYHLNHQEEVRIRHKIRYDLKREEIIQISMDYKKKHPKKVRNDKLKQNYGITLEDYNMMLSNQHDCCAICKKHKDDLKVILGVDHNHTTGKVRGLLCNKCNIALGGFNDNIELLNNAISYLIKFKE